MTVWTSITVQTLGLLSTLVFFYASTDPKGTMNWYNNQNPNFNRDTSRRKRAAQAGLLLVAVSFAIQIYVTLHAP